MIFRVFLSLLTGALVIGALSACEGNGDKIGTTIQGARIAVMEGAKTTVSDQNASDAKPKLPHTLVNLSWPQAGYDSEHTMPHADFSARPEIRWKQSIGEGSSSDFKLLAHPVVEGRVLYAMDAEGKISALKLEKGDLKWQFDTTPKDSEDSAIGGGLAADGTTLYATTGFGDVYALNADDGTVKWRKSLLKPLRAAPTVADNRVYVVSIDNDLNALDAQTGAILWHHAGITESATLMGAASPIAETDSVVVAYNSGEIFGLRAQNGRVSWTYALTNAAQVGALPAIADIRGLPVEDHGHIYAISHSGRMAALDQRSGERAWETDIGGIDTPVVAGDTLFVYGGDSQLIALARSSGRIMWVKTLRKLADEKDKNSAPVVWTGPVLAGSRLWMVNNLGQLVSYAPDDGTADDTVDVGAPIYLSPIIADHTMYIVTDEGDIIALR